MAKKSSKKSASKKNSKTAAKKTSKKSSPGKASIKKAVSKKSAPKKAAKKASPKKAAALIGGFRPFCTEGDWRGDNCFPTIKAAVKEGVRLHGHETGHAIDTESC